MKTIAMYLLLCLAICFNCDKALADEAQEESPKPIILKDIFPADESELKLMDRDLLFLGKTYSRSHSSLLYAALFADKYNLELFIYYSDDFDNEKDVSENWRLVCSHKFSWDEYEAEDIMIRNTYYNETDNSILYNIIHDSLFSEAWHTVYYDLTEDKCLEKHETKFD
ncbi:MAG TPA: hypothetical protein PKH33_18140 [bacterium]|nr:hypothetical protein [bacterium]